MIEKKVSRLNCRASYMLFFFTKIFQKFGVNNACERLLAWADIHRKAMFGITISFLSFVTILSLVMRPERKPMQVFNEEKSKVQINIDSTLQKTTSRSSRLVRSD